MFRGLSKLSRLEMDGNAVLDGLGRTDVFSGFPASVSLDLNLANNGLQLLPTMSFVNVVGKIQRLNLADNNMVFPEFNGPAAVQPTTFVLFTQLESLNLRSNGFTRINSALFQPLDQLKELDLSCNYPTIIDRQTFASMRSGLAILNMGFCPPMHVRTITPLSPQNRILQPKMKTQKPLCCNCWKTTAFRRVPKPGVISLIEAMFDFCIHQTASSTATNV